MADDDDRWGMRTQGLNSRIMIIAAVCVSVIAFLVVVVHFYARCVLSRRRGGPRAAAVAMEMGQEQTHPEPPKTGLDAAVIAALPVFVYRRGDPSSQAEECAVCLSTLEEEEEARLLPNCNHAFHAQCIDTWLHSHSTCPICRTGAEPKPRAAETPTAEPSAPPVNSSKAGEASSSRASSFSFRRMLSRERSERRLPGCIQPADTVEDLERQ